MPTPEYGLCRCGCGAATTIAKKTRTKIGHAKGEPIYYVSGHQARGRPAPNRRQDPPGMRRCSRCETTKPLDAFYRHIVSGCRAWCKACESEARKQRRASDPAYREKTRALATGWRQANPEKVITVRRDSYVLHRERIREQARLKHREWRAIPENAEAHRLRAKLYYEANKHRLVFRRDLPALRCEDKDFVAALRQDPCCYCGAPMDEIDHIVPVACGGEHGWSNFTAACFRCNRAKRARDLLFFLTDQMDSIRHEHLPELVPV